MALINCQEPNCTEKVDTTLACTEVSSLFGLRALLKHHMENQHLSSFFASHELQTQLDFVNKKLAKYGIEDQEKTFKIFKNKKQSDSIARPKVSQLFIECPKGHRHFYDVDCSA